MENHISRFWGYHAFCNSRPVWSFSYCICCILLLSIGISVYLCCERILGQTLRRYLNAFEATWVLHEYQRLSSSDLLRRNSHLTPATLALKRLYISYMMWCDVRWRDAMWCHVMWCDVVWCGVTWYDMIKRYVCYHNTQPWIPCISPRFSPKNTTLLKANSRNVRWSSAPVRPSSNHRPPHLACDILGTSCIKKKDLENVENQHTGML